METIYKLNDLIPRVDEERKLAVISILRITDGLQDFSEISPIDDRRWVGINLPIITAFFGRTKDIVVSYDKYEITLKFDLSEFDWKTTHCLIKKGNVVELHVVATPKQPEMLLSKFDYDFKAESSIEGFKCLVAKIAEIVYA